MDIGKEFNKWFENSELKKHFSSEADRVCLKLVFEIGADKMKEIILKKILEA